MSPNADELFNQFSYYFINTQPFFYYRAFASAVAKIREKENRRNGPKIRFIGGIASEEINEEKKFQSDEPSLNKVGFKSQ